MIFDGRPIDEISDDEIDKLVSEHYFERQHVELKVTVNYLDDDEKLELLRDIASLANGGGGYLVIGIREDGAAKWARGGALGRFGLLASGKRLLQLLRSHPYK